MSIKETKLSFTKDRKNMTIKELSERMKRAKKRALRRAKRYNVGKPPFGRGVMAHKICSVVHIECFQIMQIKFNRTGTAILMTNLRSVK